ncbi:hypothetical protein [Pseudidiomarina woesei]|uniref:Uncharacterized protein n=1 Tax=Pseudidiomarina woesei TaxID=1381080 RepID=A0A0K6GX61_9GAMM|nr:hypothetical protein [Pseudidiomarina woesei]CUA83337.1 hypothetical protein Ga0061064_0547 [Pseudidiomarina woesei]
MSKWIHVIYLSIIAVLSYFLWQQPRSQPSITKEIEVVKTTKAPATTVAESAKNLDTSGVNELSQTATTRGNPETQSTTAPMEEQSFVPVSPAAGASPEDEQLAEMLRNMLNMEEVKQRMQSEPTDQDWAYAMEDNLRLIYDNNENLQSASLNHIECRTTVCEIEFGNSNTPIDFMSKFHSQIVQSAWYSDDYQSMMTSDSNTKVHTIYLVRKP